MNQRSPVPPILFAIAIASASAGCNLGNGFTCSVWETAHSVSCGYQGGAQLASATFAISDSITVINGTSCLTADGTCAADAAVQLQSLVSRGGGGSLQLTFDITPNAGPGTYTLVGQTRQVAFMASVHSASYDYNSPLSASAGEIVITRNDGQRLTATFALELDTLDGLHHLSLTGGTIDIGDCSVEAHEVCISGGVD